MGIDPRPFDPKTYVEEDVYVTDESGTKKKIRLEDNIVRWRTVKNADGTTSVSETFFMQQCSIMKSFGVIVSYKLMFTLPYFQILSP